MQKLKLKEVAMLVMMFLSPGLHAQMPPSIHVEGKHLVDTHGNRVVLHGVMDTPNPYFNNNRWGTVANDATKSACIDYFDKLFTAITDSTQGAYCDVFRLHLDPCWTNDPLLPSTGTETGEANISQFSEKRLRSYLSTLYWKIIEKALNHGLYVVVRPPGVCPGNIKVRGYYQDYLLKVWDIVSSNSNIKKHSGRVMIELANEPVNILGADSTASATAPYDFFQPIVEKIRANGFDGIIWVPGTGWQSNYVAYKNNPIQGYNIGYAAHCYVGWYGCGDENANADAFIKQFGESVPVVATNPVIITEVDWSPEKPGEGHYNEHGEWVPANWGTWATGTTSRWGKAYKAVLDHYGNISMTLTGTGDYIDIDKYIADGTVAPAFDANPEACGKATFDWYADYAKVDYARPDFTNLSVNQTTDGRKFINPVIAADFPDPDVAKLGDTYYMVSTTMHLFPGATIIKSKDLVNWEYCAQPLTQLSTADKYSLLNGKNSYAQGMWAAALTAHDGKLYLLINGNDAGGFILSTSEPEGTWQTQKLDRSYYDPGMIIEDDRVYIACGIGNISICELDRDFNFIKSTTVLTDKPGLEGSHLYHIGDYYYIYATYGGWPSGQAIFRSKSITGPYEEKMLIEKIINGQPNTVHQGALVETVTGEWWTMLMEDKGPIGRLPSLHPVMWSDGWPTVANNGVPQLVYTKPDVGTTYADKILPTTDNFRSYPLGMQWEWNHNPDEGKWTLFERPGFMRLYTASVTDDVMQARNTLTQRIFAFHNVRSPYGLSTTQPSTGTVALHVKNMQEGDMAGLTIQQDPYAYIAIQVKDGKKQLVWCQDTLHHVDGFTPAGLTKTDVNVDSVIYLRAQFDYATSRASFFYSTDNKTYVALGNETELRYNLSVFVGARFGIFNMATDKLGGYVDVDWFTTETDFDEATFYDPVFEGFNKEMLTATSLQVEAANMEMMVGKSQKLELVATYQDGHTENVAAKAKYEFSAEDVIAINSGLITGRKEGYVRVKATFTDPMGNSFSARFNVTSSYFPWDESYINTTLFGNGTYREAARAFFPGTNGQMGWVYENGADMSGYKYLVVMLDKVQKVNAAVNIFPQNSIWGDCYSKPIGDATQVVIPLQEITYTSGDNKDMPVNTSNVMIVAFYASTTGVIDVSQVYLTNNDDYTPETPTAIHEVNTSSDQDDVLYNLQGIKVQGKQHRGVYIQNGKKIIVTQESK